MDFTITTEPNHHRRSLPNRIDEFESSIERKTSQYAERHDKFILQHDNARPHVAKVVKTYLKTLEWEVLHQPPYSPVIALTDYHLFRSMTHGLAKQHFQSYEDTKKMGRFMDRIEQFDGCLIMPEACPFL